MFSATICLAKTDESIPLALESPPEEFTGLRHIRRVAMLVVHSNPLAEPGAGDAGGMTVYVRQMARSLAARGITVDVYTRRDSAAGPECTELFPGVRVIQVEAGSPTLSKGQIPAHLPEFTSNVLRAAGSIANLPGENPPYDMIHSHYWLSGRVASLLKTRWGIPFVHTFHTLGLVKNIARRIDDPPEPESRLHGEARVIAEACAIVASTKEERQSLIDLYAAHPERIHLIRPGVDHVLFRPGDALAARRLLRLPAAKTLLFVGRLQPLKGADTAIRALAALKGSRSRIGEIRLVVVGGQSGETGKGELQRLKALCLELEVAEAVKFVPAQPQSSLAAFYQAADLCLVPSVTESFGLVALEAQACGVPVIASEAGGLKSIVQHGKTGFLVRPGDAEAFATAAAVVLSNAAAAARMGKSAAARSLEFSWERSGEELHGLYALSNRTSRCRSLSS